MWRNSSTSPMAVPGASPFTPPPSTAPEPREQRNLDLRNDLNNRLHEDTRTRIERHRERYRREDPNNDIAEGCLHSCQNHDSTMRFYDFTTQIESNDSTILLSRILEFTIPKAMILRFAILS